MVGVVSLKTSFPSFGASPRNVTVVKLLQSLKNVPLFELPSSLGSHKPQAWLLMRLADRVLLKMNETLTKFRNAVADSTDLQEKVKAGADLVALGKESGYEFTQEELETGWEELQESDEGLTDFELDVVAGGNHGDSGC